MQLENSDGGAKQAAVIVNLETKLTIIPALQTTTMTNALY